MRQMNLAEADFKKYRKPTRREQFLNDMGQTILQVIRAGNLPSLCGIGGRKIATACLSAGLLSGFFFLSGSTALAFGPDMATQDMVRVVSDGGHGSGFIINENGHIVTNHHVIKDVLREGELEVVPAGSGTPYLVQSYDLAVLRASGLELPPLSLSLAEPKVVEEEKRLAREDQVKQLLAEAKAPAVEMVAIPGGSFRMGDLSGDGRDWEGPVHVVTIAPFEMGKYEVTFSQWDACVADGGCSHVPDDEGWGRGNRPVINVSWDDVQGFIAWLNTKTGGGYRLPTESEWEYAARAGSESKYSWGNELGSNRANCDKEYCGDRWEKTAPVGAFASNAWGLHDMHGNVWEWVEDCWNDSYVGAPGDGSAWRSGSCSQRVIRGGSWLNTTGFLAFRGPVLVHPFVPRQLLPGVSIGQRQIVRRCDVVYSAQRYSTISLFSFYFFTFIPPGALRRAAFFFEEFFNAA